MKVLLLPLVVTMTLSVTPASAAEQRTSQCTAPGWIDKSDKAFAMDCADMAFSDDLSQREQVAWMLFTRINQQISDPMQGGMSGTDKVPQWMAWPTDPDTFATRTRFDFSAGPRAVMKPSTEKKELTVGKVATANPDGANEEVTRNQLAYDYLVDNGLTTKADIAQFFQHNDYVSMPVGSVELKASWLQVTDGSPAPPGAFTFNFDSGKYWWRGLHIMVKLQNLEDPGQTFYSESPSWFWATFEFNDNPGAQHVRETLITQRHPLSQSLIESILSAAGLAHTDYRNYAPNGTQIRFTQNADGQTPVILGHTDMEDFAGHPNTAQAAYWREFDSSCHSCHATAAYNPDDGTFFPFSVPTGALNPAYNMTDASGKTIYLGQGYKPLDFMWPIVFQSK